MRLAHPRRAEQDDVLAAVDESQLVQALDLLALDARLKAKSHCANVLTAGRREERIAACSRRLLRSAIASPAVTPPLSTCASTPSTASRAPGIFKSASIARSRSRRSLAVAVIPPPPRRPATTGAPPRWCRARAGGPARHRGGRRDAGRDGLPRDAAPHARPARSGPRDAPAGLLLFHDAPGGFGKGGHALDAALVGKGVAAGPRQLAVGERQLTSFGDRDERDGAESELAAASADDAPLKVSSAKSMGNSPRTHEQSLRSEQPSRRSRSRTTRKTPAVDPHLVPLGRAGCRSQAWLRRRVTARTKAFESPPVESDGLHLRIPPPKDPDQRIPHYRAGNGRFQSPHAGGSPGNGPPPRGRFMGTSTWLIPTTAAALARPSWSWLLP